MTKKERAEKYARYSWGHEGPTWNGNETRRLIAQAYLAGMMNAGVKLPTARGSHGS